MRWHKFISTILHPIVIPTLGVLLYFILLPLNINKQQKLIILSLVFIATYIIPLMLLVLLKAIGYIKSYHVSTIKERKIPLFLMITLFYVLGKTFYQTAISRDLSYLFYGTALALTLVYFIFFLNVKTSLHLLSMGSAVGFFLMFQQLYSITIIPVIAILIILSGFVGTSRLHLKAHTVKEVYLGFFIGFVCQFLVYWIL